MITHSKEYELKNGKTLSVKVLGAHGITGEMIEVVVLKEEGYPVKFNKVQDKMNPADARELKLKIDQVYKSNQSKQQI